MKVGAIPTHDAYAASWKDRVPADRTSVIDKYVSQEGFTKILVIVVRHVSICGLGNSDGQNFCSETVLFGKRFSVPILSYSPH
ncbi:unnamed protein product [Ranitomeya imitator]|uniref:Uncharacterized protein n=1 Tax=Ranitomeya imitator TaxID=111125 RepID=A0ABN9LC58_9NEOB|nr:unnamed protein product [Ranitomeya imitator]